MRRGAEGLGEKPRKSGAFSNPDLLVADAVVIALPPIRASSVESPHAQPSAIVIGVVGTIDPDPHAIAEDPMATAMVKVVVMIVTALYKAAMIAAITMICMATLAFAT
jgi:hypothetical protein